MTPLPWASRMNFSRCSAMSVLSLTARTSVISFLSTLCSTRTAMVIARYDDVCDLTIQRATSGMAIWPSLQKMFTISFWAAMCADTKDRSRLTFRMCEATSEETPFTDINLSLTESTNLNTRKIRKRRSARKTRAARTIRAWALYPMASAPLSSSTAAEMQMPAMPRMMSTKSNKLKISWKYSFLRFQNFNRNSKVKITVKPISNSSQNNWVLTTGSPVLRSSSSTCTAATLAIMKNTIKQLNTIEDRSLWTAAGALLDCLDDAPSVLPSELLNWPVVTYCWM
mmetsp:Transcript_136069/g.236442  ORF Transcript_136069/g.236442 Transcript_136069/m.236442 type:complete len:283 (+) Transcript_136069:1074-1922(+)